MGNSLVKKTPNSSNSNNVFNLNLKLDHTKRNVINPYFKFLRAYNREFAYAKKVSEQYNVKTNDKATYLFTL